MPPESKLTSLLLPQALRLKHKPKTALKAKREGEKFFMGFI
jgi:hypothetical protein